MRKPRRTCLGLSLTLFSTGFRGVKGLFLTFGPVSTCRIRLLQNPPFYDLSCLSALRKPSSPSVTPGDPLADSTNPSIAANRTCDNGCA